MDLVNKAKGSTVIKQGFGNDTGPKVLVFSCMQSIVNSSHHLLHPVSISVTGDKGEASSLQKWQVVHHTCGEIRIGLLGAQ